jgi:protein phosphatase
MDSPDNERSNLKSDNMNRDTFPVHVDSPPPGGVILEHAAISDQGPARKTHEDTVAHYVPGESDILAQKGGMFVIADGVGGYGGGDIASREAARVFIETYYSENSLPDRAIKAALGEANLHVYDLAAKLRHPNLSTTLSGLAIVGSRYHLAHIGDSRVYRLRAHTAIELLTEDHSEAGELVKMQILSPDRVRSHPRRHILTRSLGSDAIARPMAKSGAVQVGDYFVQCTDGVWELVEDEEISTIVRLSAPAEACRALVDLCLTRAPSDNMSIQIVYVAAVDETAPKATGGFRQAIMRLFGGE